MKLNKDKLADANEKKMSKAIEGNKMTVMIKRLFWAFNLYCKFMWTDENNNKNKAIMK